VVEHLSRAAGDPDHRVPLDGNIAAVRRVTDPLRVGRTTETHFLFGSDYFGTWDRDVITGLGTIGRDPEATVDVGELQDALRRTPLGAGLDRAVLDLVIIAW